MWSCAFQKSIRTNGKLKGPPPLYPKFTQPPKLEKWWSGSPKVVQNHTKIKVFTFLKITHPSKFVKNEQKSTFFSFLEFVLQIYWFSGLSNSVISCFSKNENFAFTTRKRCSDCIFSPKNTQNWVLNGECSGVDSKNTQNMIFKTNLNYHCV